MEEISYRLCIIIVIVSLLLNAVIIIFFLCIQDNINLHPPFQVTFEEELPEHQKKEETDKELIYRADKLISFGSSQFGTTLVVHQPEQQLPKSVSPLFSIKQAQPELQLNIKEKGGSESLASKTKEFQEIQENRIYKEHKEKDEPEINTEQEYKSEQIEVQHTFTIVEDAIPEIQYHVKKQNLKKSTTMIKKKQKISAQKNKTVTLADIAKDYMYHVAQEQENTVETQLCSLSDSKQMALRIYASKVFALLEQAAKVNQKMLYAPKDRTTDAILMLTINQNGKLLEARLTPHLYEKEICDWLFAFVNNVGLFPPIPKHLKKEKIILTYLLRIDIQQGFGTYSLYYGFYNRY